MRVTQDAVQVSVQRIGRHCGMGGRQMAKKAKRDVEKDYPAKQFVKKLRRLADTIEKGETFRIQIAGERSLFQGMPSSI